MALGSLARGLQSHKTTLALRRDGDAQFGRFAGLHYGLALAELQKTLSSGDRDVKLEIALCSLLLTIFEFLSGYEENSTTHSRAADSILQALTTRDGKSRMTCDESNLQKELNYTCQKILAASSYWRDTWAASSSSLPNLNLLFTAPFPPVEPNDLYYLHRQLALVRLAVWNFDTRPLAGPAVAAAAKHSVLSSQVNTIMSEAERIAKHSTSPLNEVRRDCVYILGLVIQYQLQTWKQPDWESVVDESCFESLLEIVDDLLHNKTALFDRVVYEQTRYRRFDTLKGLDPLFNFVTIMIEPLFFVATRSFHEHIRDKAFALLSLREWREGAWDSSVMLEMARKRVYCSTQNSSLFHP